MVKKSIITLALLSATASVMAAPTGELKVTGTITAPSCTVNGSYSSLVTYEYGNISPAILAQQNTTTLSEINHTWTIVCDGLTYLTFTATDNRGDSLMTAGDSNFGLGFNGDKKIGYYQAVMRKATYKTGPEDTPKTAQVLSGNSLTSGNISTSKYITKATGSKMGWAADTSKLAAGMEFSAEIGVTAVLAKPSDLGNLETVTLDGSMGLQFSFAL